MQAEARALYVARSSLTPAVMQPLQSAVEHPALHPTAPQLLGPTPFLLTGAATYSLPLSQIAWGGTPRPRKTLLTI